MKIAPALLLITLLFSCTNTPEKINLTQELKIIIDTDKEFSQLSGEKGMKASFLKYMDAKGILLRPDHYPIIGKDAQKYLEGQTDSSFTLTWVPASAEVADSRDLGFTYGIYTLTLHKDSSVQKGTYVSIWKKQPDGNWKFLLDTGNPGVGKE